MAQNRLLKLLGFFRCIALICTIPSALFGAKVDTFYGAIEVNEPVIIELIESPALQRLKSIHQYGVCYYTTHQENYTRYAHSLGVFVVLRERGAPLEEQIAGLLHDVSHTVFSHVGDWIFNRENQEEDYQSSIHTVFLQQSGLAAILEKHGFAVSQVLPKESIFPALEQKRPNICADRIDYNIQGAYYQNFITYEEALQALKAFRFVEGRWIAENKELMEKLTRFSLFMNVDCWSSAMNYISSRWLADAILRGIEIGLLTQEEIHFGTDQIVWDKLHSCEDPLIQKKMGMLGQADRHFCLVKSAEADLIINNKFMGIDPWILCEGEVVRLTSLDEALAKDYQATKEMLGNGWAIQFIYLDE